MSNHTLSPVLNGMKVDLRRSIMHVRANSCAARTSSRSFINVFIFSSMVGYLVFSNERGTAIGESLNINSNGVFCLSACLRLLCVNSIMCRADSQSSG